MSDKFYWLIEGKSIEETLYLSPHDKYFYWTADANQAMRFVTKEEAEGLLGALKAYLPRIFFDEIHVAEHGWVDRAGVNNEIERVSVPVCGHTHPLPISMLLWCPACGTRHIDAGEFITKRHHTHACQLCGHVWRPAIENTVGTQFLPGFKNKVDSSE